MRANTKNLRGDKVHKCERNWLSCEENEKGEFWIHGSKFSTKVNFCPFCGRKAPKVDGIEHKTLDDMIREQAGKYIQ